jgi:hypothetical protein
MHELDSVVLAHPEVTVLEIDMNTDSPSDSSGGFEIRPKGDGDLKSPILFRRITNPSELIELYDIETTPLIYVLDNEKRIIAKKIRAKQIPLVL